MWYNAVLKYADERDRNFHKFHLPDGLLEDPAEEEVTIRWKQIANPSSCTINNDSSDKSSANPASSSEEDSSDEEEDDSTNTTIYRCTKESLHG